MDKEALWHTFARTGRVEDYLRYRGVDPIPTITNSVKEGSGYDHRPKTTSDDRRADSAGI